MRRRRREPRAAAAGKAERLTAREIGLAGVALAHHEPRTGERLRVVDQLVTLDVAREELVGKRAVAGNLGERGFQAVRRVRRRDQARLLLPGPPELHPQRAHEIVERRRAVGAIAQREVEAQPDRRAPGVIGDEGIRPVRPIDRHRRVHERREPAHLLRGSDLPAGAERHGVDQAGDSSPSV